jgi:predicted metal-dependent hydrolase
VGDLVVDVVRKDIKNLHLAVYPPNGRVRVATPLRLDDEAVRLFTISRLGWIKKQQAQFASQERRSERQYSSRESHYFQGRRYLLNVIHETPPKVQLRNKTTLDLYVPEGSSQDYRKGVMRNWYRQELKKEIPPLLEKWQEIMGVTVTGWGIKHMKTKWGTCNIEEGRVWFNLELAKKPKQCLEYVVVHELVHFLERHHIDYFVAYMDKFLPNWRILKEELNHLPLGGLNENTQTGLFN